MTWLRPDNEYEALLYVARRLAEHFPWVEEDELHDALIEELMQFDGARIREFIPMLVERGVARRLRDGHGRAA